MHALDLELPKHLYTETRAPDGTLTDMRQGDGIHYTTAGARHVANRVFPLIAEDFGLDPA